MFENKKLLGISVVITSLGFVTLAFSYRYSTQVTRKWFYNVWDDISDIKNNLSILNSKICELSKKLDKDESKKLDQDESEKLDQDETKKE